VFQARKAEVYGPLPVHKMTAIDLLPIERPGWEADYNRLMMIPYVKSKCDRKRRLREKRIHIADLCHHLQSQEPGLVIDIGPGPGEFLEVCRSMGHKVIAVDAPTGEGGMGDDYVELSALMLERQQIQTWRTGLMGFCRTYWGEDDAILKTPGGVVSMPNVRDQLQGSAVHINLQGSVEQCFAKFMAGPPHHIHKDCKQLFWDISVALIAEWRHMFYTFSDLLRPDGHILIYANGAKNTGEYETSIAEVAGTCGLELVLHSPRIHKWKKQ
jgi:hypothetical protein